MQREDPAAYTADWGPSWTLDSTGPIVKLGTADITEVDHENLIFMETPEASAASDAHLQSDHSRFSPRQPQTAFRVIMPIAPTCYQLDKEWGNKLFGDRTCIQKKTAFLTETI